MLLDYMRVFIKRGISALVDLSLKNQNDADFIPADLATIDYLYIATRVPFGHLFFDVKTPNENSASMILEIWNGRDWVPVVDVLDATEESGVSLAKSGSVFWSLDPAYSGWNSISNTFLTNAPTVLQSVKLYNMYWMRISFSGPMSAAAKIQQIGYAFTISQELKRVDADIDNYMRTIGIAQGNPDKSDWNSEIMTASRLVVSTLKGMGLIMNPGEIVSVDDVSLPTTYKTLSILYYMLGPAYEEKRKKMEVEFNKTIKVRRFTFDLSGNGKLDAEEIVGRPITRVR